MSSTVDASVWVAAHVRAEVVHAEARAVVEALVAAGEDLHQPTLTVVEVASAIHRRVRNERAATRVLSRMLQIPGMTFHALDVPAALDAAAHATRTALRGADAIYLATAAATGSTLITFDTELRDKAPGGVSVMTPAEWVASRTLTP